MSDPPARRLPVDRPIRRETTWRSGHTANPSTIRVVGEEKRTPNFKDMWRLLLAIIGVIAVIQELRKPEDERTWHGQVANFVPYDFRMPTVTRVRDTYWNPDGPVFTSKVFGVGWAPNFGAWVKMFQRSAEQEPLAE